MKNLFPLLGILLLAGACAKPQGTENVIELPEKSHVVQVYAVKIDNDHLFWAKLPDIR